MTHISIETMTEQDWPSVRRIYEEGIATGNATFETSVPDWREWDAVHLRATVKSIRRRKAESNPQ